MTEQAKVPAIRFAGFTDPWEQRKLGELFFESNERSSSMEILSVSVAKGIYPASESDRDTNPGASLVNYKVVHKGDVVYNSMRMWQGAVGSSDYDGIVSPAYVVARPTIELDSTCFGYLLKRPEMLYKYLCDSQGNSKDTQTLKYDRFADIEATMPANLEEQRAISACLESVDHLITLHQRKYDKLVVFKKSMLEKMFPKDGESVPEIRFAGFTDPWEQRKLGELGFAQSGIGFPDAEQGGAEGTPFFKVSDMNTPGNEYELAASKNYVTAEQIARMGWHPLNQVPAIFFAKVGAAVMLNRKRLVNEPFLLDNNTMAFSMDSSLLDTQFGQSLFERLDLTSLIQVGALPSFNSSDVESISVSLPSTMDEQRQIGQYLCNLNTLITLHQRKRESRIIRVRSFIWLAGDISGIGVSAYQPEREDRMTEGNTNAETLFCDYYEQWISVYKEGAIREVTMKKYRLTQAWLGRLIPDLKLADMDRVNYQKLINGYAEHHERQTTMDFHHQLKGAILDAVDEGLIQRDPTRKAIIKGKPPCSKKTKYLNQFELHAVLADLELGKGPSWDWLILLVAKTGLRFSEALGLTPDDFDFVHQTLSVSKTWDYKNGGGFVPTKNASSVRKVQLDWQLIMQLSTLLKDMPASDPIFVNGKVYNSTANNILARHCERANVPVISIHGLRHTHASLLLFAGVSIASVSKRLGHASMNTTQDTYLHVIRELENKDVDIVMRALSTLI